MTLELNVFHLRSKHKPSEEQESEEVCLIDTGKGEHYAQKLQEELMESIGEFDEKVFTLVTPPVIRATVG